ncbi:Methionyl-tRNA synthetase, partial [hydrothermal vent metagenome]
SMTGRYFDGVVPEPGTLGDTDTRLLESRETALAEVAEQLDGVRLRGGLARAMQIAGDANAYLNDLAPWSTAKTDMERTGTTLWVAHQLIATAAVAFAPYLPATSIEVLGAQGVASPDAGPSWEVPTVSGGTVLGELGPLFAKVELDTGE